MFTRVEWSDSAVQDVALSPITSVEELSVSMGSSNVRATAPSGDTAFWQLGIAVGAVKECVESVVATWKVCGSDVASTYAPLLLDLPDPSVRA